MSEHFSLWQERCLANDSAMKQAKKMVDELRAHDPLFNALCHVEQSAPFHGEGPRVEDHLVRSLTFLFALQEKETALVMVDEWCSARHLRGFFLRLQETIQKEEAFIAAYILAHDIGKKDTARQDEAGWHYKEHAHKGADAVYASFREQCLARVGCSASEGKLLRELVRIHMNIIWELGNNPETRILIAAREIAERQGINVERFLALIPAVFLLDAVVGSLDTEKDGFAKASLMLRYAEREYASFPQRQEEDVRKLHREEKEMRRIQLVAAGLGNEEWFVRLHTPYGKERGKVVAILDRFMRGVEDEEDVRYVGKENAQELRARSARIQEIKT